MEYLFIQYIHTSPQFYFSIKKNLYKIFLYDIPNPELVEENKFYAKIF